MAPGIHRGPGCSGEENMRRIFAVFFLILLAAHPAWSQEAGDNQKPQDEIKTPEPQQESQPEIEAATLRFELSTRFQTVGLDTGSSKATEYRSLPDGLYIDNLLFSYGSRRQELEGDAARISPLTNLINDGYGDVAYRRYGLLSADVGISKSPHDYGAASNDVMTQRDTYSLLFKFSPGDRLIISTNLSVEERNGKRPLTVESLTGTTINPTAIIEIKEPVDYTTTSIDLGLEYIDNLIDLQLNNSLQIFSSNLTDSVSWNNPYISGATGRVQTSDDYMVHALTVRPAIQLTSNMRLVNTLSYSKVTNNINLAPFSTAGIGESFERNVIDPDVRSLVFSSLLATRPRSDIKLNIKYRHHAYKNDTPTIEETPAYVLLDGGDSTLIRYPRIPRYISYAVSSMKVESTWTLTERSSLDAGIENKDTSRSDREVDKENEKILSLRIRSMLRDNLSGRFGYTYTRRRGDYDPSYYKVTYDPNPANDVAQHPLMRAFDLSALDSNALSAGLDYSPVNALDLGTTLSLIINEHPDVSIGRRHSQGESAASYAQYALFESLRIYAEYFYDHRRSEGRYSWTFNSALPYPQDPNPQYSNFTTPINGIVEDTNNVYSVGLNLDLDGGLSLDGSYNRYDSRGSSTGIPDVSYVTDIYELNASYSLSRKIDAFGLSPIRRIKDIRMKAGYSMERYQRTDYTLNNFPDTGTDIFLGIREPDYNLHVFSLSLNLYF